MQADNIKIQEEGKMESKNKEKNKYVVSQVGM